MRAWRKTHPHAVLQFPGSLPEKTQRELREAWERSNWSLGLPSRGDTVSFSSGYLSINEVRQLEGLPALQAGGKQDDWSLGWPTRTYPAYPKVDFEAPIDVFAGIGGEPDTLKPPPLRLRQRFRKWMSRPSHKPFLKPSRQHWWQFWLQTDEQFVVWLDKKALNRKRKRRKAAT